MSATPPPHSDPAADRSRSGQPDTGGLDIIGAAPASIEERRARLHAEVAATRAKRVHAWRGKYRLLLTGTDLVAILIATFGVQLLWLDGNEAVFVREDSAVPAFSYALFSSLFAVAWMVALSLYNTRDHRIAGEGPDEYKRVLHGSVAVFGVIAILAFILRVDVARGYLMLSLPLGLVLLIGGRFVARRFLQRLRRRGRAQQRTLVVGTGRQARDIMAGFARSPWSGFRVVAACLPARSREVGLGEVPIYRGLGTIPDVLERHTIDAVVVASNDALTPEQLRELMWKLDPGRHELIVAPGLLDIGGPRITTRPVSGLPLMHVRPVYYTRSQRVLKRTTDVVGSGVGLVLISPLLAVLAVLVKTSSPGPVLFRQERVGKAGAPFTMLKFRSMVPNAETLLEELKAQRRDAGNAVLFKMKDDPRITPIGRFMRRYSLDELPQLVNVLRGEMSLVGPRPPLFSEVAEYEQHVDRRFLVQPGITGLWQVSGRSNLSWQETVRLDLFYVENWSLTGDVVILARTLRAVVGRDGAY